ncbi:auxin-responsive family protein [Tasmannia lanceolata]|uniref:auxin-responsive family protein n=1 Tax=Tasmannia lanceolata TaxID=3420 RepID=UPI0040632FBF
MASFALGSSSSSKITPWIFIFPLFLLTILPSISASTCSSQKFSMNKNFEFCNDLPQLSSYLHWSYDSSKSSLNLAFVATPPKPTGWISWAINPTSTGMIGSQSLIAFRQSNGQMIVKTFNITGYGPISPSEIAFEVSNMVGEYSGGEMRIFATMILPKNMTTINQVWQVGSSVEGEIPQKHAFGPANLNSKGTLDLLKGESSSSSSGGGSNSRLRDRNIHGVLNAVGWGILMPIGAIIARYLRTFESADPAWFYLHVGCQVSAYAVGLAGWITGLKLGGKSVGVRYTAHRNIGIALFSLATLQVFSALLLRPNKDHKFRRYWNYYHHSVGFTVIILSVINIFKGFNILEPEMKWKTAYASVIIVLGVIAALLEVITWIVVLRRRKSANRTKL